MFNPVSHLSPIDTYWTHEGQKFVLIDTAGMRRKSKIEEAVERYSIVRSLRSVDPVSYTHLVLQPIKNNMLVMLLSFVLVAPPIH